jgi:hypothetical protein
MLGPEGVTRGLYLHADANLPGRLAILRARYGTDAAPGNLPDFATIYPDEIITRSIEQFPALSIVIPNTTGQIGNRQTDLDAMFEEYSYRYTVQLYSYVLGDTPAAASLAIKRYTLAVRESFLFDKILPVADGNDATIDPKTLVESYSELDTRESQFILASVVQFEVVTHERLDAPAGFTDPAEIIVTDPQPLTQHPYFAEQ